MYLYSIPKYTQSPKTSHIFPKKNPIIDYFGFLVGFLGCLSGYFEL